MIIIIALRYSLHHHHSACKDIKNGALEEAPSPARILEGLEGIVLRNFSLITEWSPSIQPKSKTLLFARQCIRKALNAQVLYYLLLPSNIYVSQ